MAKANDQYPNIMARSVTLSAANTITFEEFNVGLNIFDKVGLLINRVEYSVPAAAIQEIVTTADIIELAITTSNQLADLSADEEALLDRKMIDMNASRTAEASVFMQPFVTDWSNLPGGGVLTPPRPLYLGGDTSGFAAAHTFTARIFFLVKSLSQGDYLELLESRRFLGA